MDTTIQTKQEIRNIFNSKKEELEEKRKEEISKVTAKITSIYNQQEEELVVETLVKLKEAEN